MGEKAERQATASPDAAGMIDALWRVFTAAEEWDRSQDVINPRDSRVVNKDLAEVHQHLSEEVRKAQDVKQLIAKLATMNAAGHMTPEQDANFRRPLDSRKADDGPKKRYRQLPNLGGIVAVEGEES